MLDFSRRAAALSLALPLACAGLALWLPAAVAATVTGSGRQATEARPVASFDAVRLEAPVDLIVRQSDAPGLQVKADDNLLPLLETVVEGPEGKGGTLIVRWKRGTSTRHTGPVTVSVATPTLRGLSVAGAGTARVEAFRTPALQLAIAGSGDVRLAELTAEELGVRVSGSGDVSGAGEVRRVKVTVAGSGDVKLDRLQSQDAQVSIAGSGDVHVQAQQTLAVSIAGSGSVVVSGSAAITSQVSGSGSVQRR